MCWRWDGNSQACRKNRPATSILGSAASTHVRSGFGADVLQVTVWLVTGQAKTVMHCYRRCRCGLSGPPTYRRLLRAACARLHPGASRSRVALIGGPVWRIHLLHRRIDGLLEAERVGPLSRRKLLQALQMCLQEWR